MRNAKTICESTEGYWCRFAVVCSDSWPDDHSATVLQCYPRSITLHLFSLLADTEPTGLPKKAMVRASLGTNCILLFTGLKRLNL